MPDLRNFIEFMKDALWYVIAFFTMAFLFTFVLGFNPIAGNSMNPNLKDGDVVIVSKFAYTFSEVKRNDIIVFRDSKDRKYVKRVIGLPGEEIDFLNDILYINGDINSRENIIKNTKTNNFTFSDICSLDLCPEGKIPSNKYLVLGDNREDSQDSRDEKIGLVDKDKIDGKIVFRIWPIKEIGKLFY